MLAATAPPETEQKPLDLLEGRPDLIGAIKIIALKCMKQDGVKRREEVLAAREQRFYWMGKQYIWFNERMGCYFSFTQTGQAVMQGSSGQSGYTDVYNMYTPYGRAIIAAFTQNQPGVRFKAQDPTSGNDLTAQAECERYRHYFDRSNDNKRLQQNIAKIYWTDGRAVTYTRWDEKQQKEISEAFGALESKCSMIAKKLIDCPYFVIPQEVEVVNAKEDFPDYAEKIKAGKAGFQDDYERMARLGVLQGGNKSFGSGDAYNHIATQYWFWFRPAMFHEVGEVNLRKELRTMFPDGCRVTFIGDQYCGIVAESMDDHLEVSFPLPGDGMSRQSMGACIVPVQDVINDTINQWKETYDYAIPTTWGACAVVELAAFREQIAEPGAYQPMKKPIGERMEDQFFRELPPEMGAEFIKFLEMLWGNMAQFMTGALPALFGAADSDNQTRGGIAMMREQAMGQMGLPWGSMQLHFAKVYEQAANIAGEKRSGTENLEIPKAKGSGTRKETLNFAGMKEGKVHCFPDTDSSFPETYSAKRAALAEFIKLLGPMAEPLLALPTNQEIAKSLGGLEEFDVPGAKAFEKQARELEELLKNGPQPDEDAFKQAMAQWTAQAEEAQMVGGPFNQPKPDPGDFLKSSVEIDPVMDNHQYHFQYLQDEFFEDTSGDDVKRTDFPKWMNVRLHALAHKKAADAAQGAPQNKPPSTSINYKDLQPDGQVQLAAQAGIRIQPPPPEPIEGATA